MSNNPGFNELMDKYLAGKASREEWDELRGMINKGSFDDAIKNRIDAEWDSGVMEPDVSFERYHEMIGNIMSAESHIASIIPLKPNRRRSIRRLAIAAVITGLLVLPFAGWWWQTREKKSPVAIALPAAKVAAEEEVVEVQSKFVRLPDGSTVLLADNSRLEYNRDFKGDKREVRLWGEAYFDIKEVAGKPFIVKTGKLSTQVLGTAFNVKTSADQQRVVVTVTRGKVKVADEKNSYGVLVADQQLSVNMLTSTVTRAQVKSMEVVKWKDEFLVLDDVSMEEAAVMIGDKYHVKILFANESLKHCRIAGSFFHNQPLEKVLTIICSVANAGYTIYPNDKVVLNGEGCANQ
ncbi:FecR family protein [Chitinophaga sp. RAB17]|uniref:FecR family protein n=1 Tax=Chitinophaga sp. RAB17 TaxID=3233049 RepID=UPI003F92B46B